MMLPAGLAGFGMACRLPSGLAGDPASTFPFMNAFNITITKRLPELSSNRRCTDGARMFKGNHAFIHSLLRMAILNGNTGRSQYGGAQNKIPTKSYQTL